MNHQGISLRAMASDATEATVDVVGVIGWEVGYEQLKGILGSLPDAVKRVTFDIFSPGGDVWQGNAIVQMIGELGKRVETVAKVQVAASMATLLAVACKTRLMAKNGRFLIHNAWTQTVGDADEHEKVAKELRDCEIEAAKFYAERTGKKPEAMLALMAEERWLMPDEALQLGFITEVCDPFKPEEFAEVKASIVASGKWPQALAELPDTPAEPEKKEDGNGDGETAKPEGDGKADDGKDDAKPADAPAPAPEPAPAAPAPEPTPEPVAAPMTPEQLETIIHARVEVAVMERVSDLQKRQAVAEEQRRVMQGERDKLVAARAADAKASAEREAKLKEELETMVEKVKRFTAGAMTFEASVETWEDAVRKYGNTPEGFAKATANHPDLRKKFVDDQKKRNR